jgi:late competence protein required for DNA uptake (superfamily II DNA/RNA helicase)
MDNSIPPPFDYEQLVYNTLQNHKHVWIKKTTGLGITEFMLRYMAWLCLRDKTLEGSQMSIVTGPRIDLAIGLIDRLKRFLPTTDLSLLNSKRPL